MGNLCNPVLSEEQMAAYLDGMLSTEDNNMVEELIDASPEMDEIRDVIDSVDYNYIYECDNEVPIECMADDFTLPAVDADFSSSDDMFSEELYSSEMSYDELSDEQNNEDYMDGSTDMGNEEHFHDDEYDVLSF